jgi:hypothetical protein
MPTYTPRVSLSLIAAARNQRSGSPAAGDFRFRDDLILAIRCQIQ